MRWTLISFLCIVAINNALGQKHVYTSRIEGTSPINIGLDEVNKRFTPPSADFQMLKSASANSSNINVTYVDFPQEAKMAFEYAVSIWEQKLNSKVPITVIAKWESITGSTLAHSRPSMYFKNFDAAPIPDVYYPVALVEKLSDKEWNDSKEADIWCSFNKNTPWYYGVNGDTPEASYDFVTVVLHELAHGFGISGFLAHQDDLGEISNPGNIPSAYDYFLYNSENQRISDNSIFNSPSTELHQQLTSDNLDFGCIHSGYTHSESEIHAPSTWRDGVSIYHLKSTQSNTTEGKELMSPYLYKGEANHNPGVNTLNILAELGWNSNTFQIAELKDIEETGIEVPVQIELSNILPVDNSSIEIVYSTDNFITNNSTKFILNQESQKLEALLTINNYKGKIRYYFKAKTTENEIVTQPKQAPATTLDFKIGTDYYSPQLLHNPSQLVSSLNPTIDFSAIASDNLGIKQVKIEYQINGSATEEFQLNQENTNSYTGKLHLPGQISKDDIIEYRIVAEDISARGNKKFLPAQGFYQVEVFETLEPAHEFYSDFNSLTEEFTTVDFEIGVPAGFNTGILHTNHPYPTSSLENDKYNLIAILNQPIILEENGQMTFDEIVLVEPGEAGTVFTDDLFWDYVIVEASKNNGENWHPLVDGYDSGVNSSWETRFTDALKSTASSATATESMFWNQSINLTDNAFFSAGDTVVFRFRLSSDKSVNGWGWAIDNLQIQSISTANEEILSDSEINMYPNPCTNNLFIDCMNMTNSSSVVINITDLYGKTVYRETRYDVQYEPKLKVDLSNVTAGIYLASITDSNSNSFTQKIIKN